MKFPPPTRKDHERFCVVEGWELRKTAKGSTGTDHVRYEFALSDGRILYTRISHPVDRTDYGARRWSHILRDQLMVTEQEFWDCVRDGQKPNRKDTAETPADAIPLGVVQALIQTFHIPEAEVRAMTRDEAIRRLAEGYSGSS